MNDLLVECNFPGRGKSGTFNMANILISWTSKSGCQFVCRLKNSLENNRTSSDRRFLRYYERLWQSTEWWRTQQHNKPRITKMKNNTPTTFDGLQRVRLKLIKPLSRAYVTSLDKWRHLSRVIHHNKMTTFNVNNFFTQIYNNAVVNCFKKDAPHVWNYYRACPFKFLRPSDIKERSALIFLNKSKQYM